MPFVTAEHRVEGHVPCAVGDLCYVEYKKMVDAWKAELRWTTAHKIYKDLIFVVPDDTDEDEFTAKLLAWQVFFIKYVMKYEDLKEQENGTI